MWKILRFRYRSVFKQNIKKEKKKGGDCRPHLRPGPAPRPARSGTIPAPTPALSGLPAGLLGWASGLRAGLGRFPGRPTRVASPGLPLPRPRCRPGPAPGPACSGGVPAPLPAWAGCQAGPMAGQLAASFPFCCFFFQRLHFWSPYLRGFFPKNKRNFWPIS